MSSLPNNPIAMLAQPPSPRPLAHLRDEELITAFREHGDTRFFTELFHRYAHLVLGTCCHFTKSLAEGEDLTMQVFEKCLHRSSSMPLRSFSNWLFIVTRNECIQHLRQCKKRETAQQTFHDRHFPFGTAATDNHPLELEEHRRRKLLQAIEKLKPEQRRCIELFFFEQKTYREIARETKYSIRAVKSHLQNGKRRLRILLE